MNTEASLCKHWRINDKKQLYKVISEKVETSLELVKIRLRLGFYLRPRNYESHALTTQPWTQDKSQIVASNEAENRCFEISSQHRDYNKSATK